MSVAVARDKTGKWLPGVSGNPLGAKAHKSKVRLKYLETMADECTLEDWRLITRRAIDDAIDGKASARNWLSSYILGRYLTSRRGNKDRSSYGHYRVGHSQ
jgi:hypothetical protein